MSNADNSRGFGRVLIVDDNAHLHQDFQKILASEEKPNRCDELAASLFGSKASSSDTVSFELDHAYQGQEALELVVESVSRNEPYGAAFVDVRMPPGWDGIETIERIWQVDPQLQCVVCTAYSDYSLADMTAKLAGKGQFIVLKKPFDSIEVQQLATTICERRRLAEIAQRREHELEDLVSQRTQELRLLAETDPLTKLPNRSVFIRSLEACVKQGHSPHEKMSAVLYIDLDNFKLVNDSLGHDAGDDMLIQVANRLRQKIRSEDGRLESDQILPARLGGDEFAILMRDLDSIDLARSIAERVRTALQQPIVIDGREIAIGASIGCATINRQSIDAAEILRNADTAMYDAKRNGKNRVSEFRQHMHEEAAQQLSLESDLKIALAEESFEIYFQPLVSLAELNVIGYEALIRWSCRDGRIRTPADFITTAEESGVIVPIGNWMFVNVCRLMKSHQLHMTPQGSVSINASRRQLVERDFVSSIEQIVNDYDLPGTSFNIEITESAIIADSRKVHDSLNALRALGMRIHLDDFGTGMSSLGCLHRFPIDAIKIDQSFVSGDSDQKRREALIEAIIRMADVLGLEVIAEGIETKEQLEFLRSLHCPIGQGFLLGEPALATQILASPNKYNHADETIENLVVHDHGLTSSTTKIRR